MTVSPESIEVGKCYLADRRQSPQVWQVTTIFADGRLEYKNRPIDPKARQHWRSARTTAPLFALTVTREVPCDWSPGGDEASQ